MPKKSNSDLITPKEGSDALKQHVSPQMIRKRVRDGDLKCHWQQERPGLIFVSRRELMKLYRPKIEGWKGVKR